MKKKLLDLKYFNLSLWISLCMLGLVPAVYQTAKTFLLSAGGQSNVFDIMGQMEWYDLINETLQAFLIVPLYSVLNKISRERKEDFAFLSFETGAVVFVLYSVFSVFVLHYTENMTAVMISDINQLSEINSYLRLETVGFMMGIAVSFANVVFVVAGKSKNIYYFLAVRTILSFAADFFMIPNFGPYGAAISNITVNTILAFATYIILYYQKLIKPSGFKYMRENTVKNWCKTGIYAGFQQFTDNFIYAVMVCKMVNAVAEQGSYWIANNFIWGWLLIPVTALAEVIRSDCKKGYENLRKFNYYFICAAVVLLWALSVPIWIPFFKYAENLDNYREIFSIVIKLAPFYIAYMGCVIIDNIFIGLGKTIYNAVNSLAVNILYYGIFYLLYITDTVKFDMDTIIVMFGGGMVFHFVISVVQERLFFKNSR